MAAPASAPPPPPASASDQDIVSEPGLGAAPSALSDGIANAAAINARLEQGKTRLHERAAQAQTNAQGALANAQLHPFLLIPDPVWSGDAGTFLMSSLDLYPHDDWNVVFLAADLATASAIDIAPHPNAIVPTFVAAAEKLLTEIRVRMKRAGEEVELTADYAAFNDAREDAQLRVKGLAMSFARALIENWETHKDASLPALAEAPIPPPGETAQMGRQTLVDEIREEAEQQATEAAVSLARRMFAVWDKQND